MCFSAEASFISGTVLAVAGVVSVKKVKSKSQLLFASIPLIFAVQQITEGLLWLSLKHRIDDCFQMPTTYLFLIFAQVFWPTMVPLSILLIEKNAKRKHYLTIVLAIGAVISVGLLCRLLAQNIHAEISNHHIFYDLYTPPILIHVLAVFYVITIVAPPFLSTIKKMKSIAIILFISFLITKIFYSYYFISVWCFFAAIVSIAIYTIEHELQEKSA